MGRDQGVVGPVGDRGVFGRVSGRQARQRSQAANRRASCRRGAACSRSGTACRGREPCRRHGFRQPGS